MNAHFFACSSLAGPEEAGFDSEPLPFHRFQEDHVEQVGRLVHAHHDVVLDHPAQIVSVLEQVFEHVLVHARERSVGRSKHSVGSRLSQG